MQHINPRFLSFLKSVEGNEYKPYVPPVGNSGVTIGIGVDLAYTNPDWLDIPDELKNKLRPFFRVRGDTARYALLGRGLELTKEEVDLISIQTIKIHLQELESWYNRDSKIPFDMLTDNQQIVLLSVKYQYGYPPSRTPKFWGYATDNDWKSVYYELMDFGDQFPTRRQREAALLMKDFKNEFT